MMYTSFVAVLNFNLISFLGPKLSFLDVPETLVEIRNGLS